MKRIFLLLAAFAAGTSLQAQSSFQKAISIPFISTPAPKSIVQCSDGGYLIGTGTDYMSSPSSCVVKTDAMGQVTWTKSIASAGGSFNLIQAGECSGGYFIFSENSDSLWMNSGFSVTKLDLSGNVVWAKVYPNSYPGYGSSKIRATSDGGFLISESLASKMGALKIDANGTILWHTAFTDDPNDQSPKCPSFDCFINSDGSMLFTGKRNSDILLVKTNATGQMQWSSTIGNQTSYYHANGISSTADGGYIVCGYADFYPFAMKVSATGTVTWYHAFDCVYGGEFTQIRELANGKFVALGSETYSGAFVVMLDANGSVLSSSAFSNNTSGAATMTSPNMCATSDGGFAIAGLYSDPSNGLTALSIMKTDVNGNFACDFNYYPLSFLASQLSPSVLSVPIYEIPQMSSSTVITATSTSLMPTEVDFCILFSTNDQLQAASAISVYPSPVVAGENLTLAISGVEGEATVSVYDANGRMVKTLSQNIVTNGIIEIATADFASGIYLVRMTGANENVLGTTRFIVR
ncbi:MAG: T9SS type A sorting domain-containing protein [Bacteroidota bacterium]|nr:T9SS type A sorting domain-containing protein [Bacteroidota bacterium]